MPRRNDRSPLFPEKMSSTPPAFESDPDRFKLANQLKSSGFRFVTKYSLAFKLVGFAGLFVLLASGPRIMSYFMMETAKMLGKSPEEVEEFRHRNLVIGEDAWLKDADRIESSLQTAESLASYVMKKQPSKPTTGANKEETKASQSAEK